MSDELSRFRLTVVLKTTDSNMVGLTRAIGEALSKVLDERGVEMDKSEMVHLEKIDD